MRIFLILSLFFLTGCAGKPNTTLQNLAPKRNRFISLDKKFIFVGSIFNHTDEAIIDTKFRERLVGHFNLSDEILYTQSYNTADLYLGLEFVTKTEETLVKFNPDELDNIRFYLEVLVSIKDIKSNYYYIKEKEVKISTLKQLDAFTPDLSREEAFFVMFDKLFSQIDSLMETGNLLVDTIYGYENYQEESNPLIDRTVQDTREETIDDSFKYGDEEEELTEEQRRELELQELDRQQREDY